MCSPRIMLMNPSHNSFNRPVRQPGRREICRHRETLAVKFDCIALARVNETEAGFDRCRSTGATEVNDRSYWNPVTIGQLQPRWRRTRGEQCDEPQRVFLRARESQRLFLPSELAACEHLELPENRSKKILRAPILVEVDRFRQCGGSEWLSA
jgi:hypothetical protein